MRDLRLMRFRLAIGDPEQHARAQPDRNGQRHAHADRTDELGVGLAEEFADEAEGAVAQEEQRRDQAGPLIGAEHAQRDLQDHEQHHAFQRRFIQLAGMARQRAGRAGKIIAQGTSVTRPHNSPFTKLAMPAEEQADGREGAGQIGDRHHLQLAAAAEQPHRDHHAQQSAMEGHAAFPGGDDAHGIGEEPHRQSVAEGGIVRA